MSPINNLAVVAFATAALAIPHAQWQPFKRHAHPQAPPAYGSSSAAAPAGYGTTSSMPVAPVGTGSPSGYPYPAGNSSVAWGSGSGTGYGSGVARPTGYSGSASVCTETSTLIFKSSTEYSTYFVTHTVTPSAPATGSTPAGPATGSASAGGYPTVSGPAPVGPATGSAPGGYGSCTPDVTVTTTEKTTVYVTAGASSSEAAPVQSSAAPPAYSSAAANKAYTDAWSPPKGHHGHHHSSHPSSKKSKAAPTPISSAYVSSSSAAAPSTYAPASSSDAPAPASSSYAPSSYAASSSSAAAPSPTGGSGGGSGGAFNGKRGLAYNDASLCDAFSGSSAGWVYNWVSNAAGYSGSLPYVPMLWGDTTMFTSVWQSDAQSAIDNGAEYLFGMNEPDNAGQANMSPSAAAAFWKQYMEPFAGKAKLVAPSVTNGNNPGSYGSNPGGLDWLSAFLTACDGCTIDAVNTHWYDYTSNDAASFKEQYQNATQISGKPVFMSEFGAIGSDSEISGFLNQVMPEMDSDSNVLGYAYFMVSDGLLVNGNSLSAYGATYAA